ncbi:histidine kinase [Microbacterium sp. 3J1]|uniref:sensor histidine kinase n=1 Tax=Microbacterium sp. 3J1 TaxID=861269 RepID=UPI000A498484|nr:histidine kinase [Microbacterium sp. 3J1]
MSILNSRSLSVREDEGLRLPRPPGVLRRFWARHPIVADVLLMLLCMALSLLPATTFSRQQPEPFGTVLSAIAPVLIVAACVSLLWRRRAPLVPFVASFAVETIFLFAQLPVGTPLILVTCYSLAVYRSSRLAWAGFGIAVAVLAGVAGLLTLAGVATLQIAVNTTVSSVVLGMIGTLIGVNVGGRKRYLDAVIDRSRQLLVERDQQAQLAAAAERARIAREMHDIVSHSLTVIVALSEGAAATPDPAQARIAASSAADTARGALTEMRAMLGVLRADDSPLPLAPLEPTSPHDTVSSAQRAGYPATIAVSGEAEVSPTVAHAVGRIVQEGVTNAMRHAPAATTIAVRLSYAAEAVEVEIVNNGVDGGIGRSGFGLRGLAERASHAGGTMTSAPTGDGRWILRATLPTAPPAQGASSDLAGPAPAPNRIIPKETRP